ncbi:MAG: DUF2283 domain-containing protein [Flavobacteriales bacterium]
MMKFEYDKDVDGLYIWFVESIEDENDSYESEVWPVELNNEIGILFDRRGRLFGIEVMPASKYFEQRKLDEFSEASY